jgi:hypothetical protein
MTTTAPSSPPLPPTLSFSNIPSFIVYLGSLAVFIMGLLTTVGVVLPSGVSGTVQSWAGVASMIASALLPLVALISHHGVQKAAIASPTTTLHSTTTTLHSDPTTSRAIL